MKKIRPREIPKRRTVPIDIRHKLDRTLSTLIELDDDDIVELLATEDQRTATVRQLEPPELSDRSRVPYEQQTPPEQSPATMQAETRGLRRIDTLTHPLLWAIDRRELRPIRIRAIVHFTGNRRDLESFGVQVRTQAQDIFTITGTSAQLADIAAQPACLRMRAPRRVFPLIDEAVGQAEVDDAHTPRPVNPNGYTGDGVLLGIIDSALDVTHATFREVAAPHDSRVLYYWVQEPDAAAALGQTPQAWSAALPAGSNLPDFNGLNYGRLYTQADINTALANAGGAFGSAANQISCEPTYSVSPTGWITSEHGTHCAGIAAGNGMDGTWAVQADRVGAAPEAVIVFVQLLGLSAEIDVDAAFEDELLDGIEFCRRVADAGAHNMPLVISVSQGTSFGPHDGTQLFDQARDNILNSWNNRSIVWSAGNDNDDDGFATGSIGAGASVSFDLSGEPNTSWAWLDIWFRGPDPRFRFTRAGVTSPWQAAGSNNDLVVNGHDIEVEWDLDTSDTMHGLRLYFPDSAGGVTYTIELENTHASIPTTYYAWVGHQAWTANLNNAVADSMTLSDTAAAKSILTVGACRKLFPPNPAAGEPVTSYSGSGPTADGRVKPEIVAVGGHGAGQTTQNKIWSAASDQAHGWHPMAGTSMATPLVAGAVALLLQECAGLGHDVNQDEIKGLLARHANRLNLDIDPTVAGFDQIELNRYGYGRLRALGAIDQVQPPAEVDLWVRTATDDYGLEPYPGGCFCQSPDIKVCQAGTSTELNQINWGTTYDVKVKVRNLGDSDAVGTTVRLKYTYPHTAPTSWTQAEDASNNDCVQSVTIDAMDDREIVFSWRPELGEVSGAPTGQTHFCLLAEVDHTLDPLAFSQAGTSGGAAWTENIKGSNNVALQNLHIQ